MTLRGINFTTSRIFSGLFGGILSYSSFSTVVWVYCTTDSCGGAGGTLNPPAAAALADGMDSSSSVSFSTASAAALASGESMGTSTVPCGALPEAGFSGVFGVHLLTDSVSDETAKLFPCALKKLAKLLNRFLINLRSGIDSCSYNSVTLHHCGTSVAHTFC